MMGTTRIEQAIDEQEIDGDDFDLSCSDVRLAQLAHDSSSNGDSGHDFESLWSDR